MAEVECPTSTEEATEFTNEWAKGLFQCCDGGVVKCLVIALSGSCAYGRAMELLTNGHHSCLQCCILAPCCFICSRVRVHNKYKIKGISGSDYLLSLCCSSCVLLQLVVEAEKVSKTEIGCLGSLKKDH